MMLLAPGIVNQFMSVRARNPQFRFTFDLVGPGQNFVITYSFIKFGSNVMLCVCITAEKDVVCAGE